MDYVDFASAPSGRRCLMQLAGAAALSMVITCLGAAPASAEEDPALQAGAAQAYADAYGVSVKEGLRRVDFQDEVTPALGKLKAALGDSYAGAWFDESDGGRLKIAVAGRRTGRQDDAADLLRSNGVLAQTDFVDVEWSFDQLTAAQADLNKRIAGVAKASGAETAVDVRTNSIVVTRSKSLSDDESDTVQGARAASRVPVRERLVEGKVDPKTTAGCTLPYCDSPLRGGVRMFDSYGTQCTAGFNVTSRSDGKRYLMTAGHCLGIGDLWMTRTAPYTQAREIGHTHNYYWGSTGDAGIIRDELGTYWQQSPFPGPTVVVDEIPGSVAYIPDYSLADEADAIPGQAICVTGAGGTAEFWAGQPYASWTWCGVVTANPVSQTFDVWTVNNLVQTNICFTPGMSGGPNYKNHLAYGTTTGEWCGGGHQEGYFFPAIREENLLNVNIVH